MSAPVQNTLYVTQDGSRLSKDGDTVVVTREGQKLLQVPYRHLAGVVCLARAWATPELLHALAESQVSVAFFGATGRFLARVEGLPGGGLSLRRAQFRAAEDDGVRLELARSFVIGKVSNQRALVLRARRDAEDESVRAVLTNALSTLSAMRRAAAEAHDIARLRGTEGASASTYFGVWEHLLKVGDERFRWRGRNRRPPRDAVNALLSFGYALLMSDCSGALAGLGLDPALGYLHEDRPGRLSLALDLMEELRSPVVDRFVLALVNRGQMTASDFVDGPGPEVRLAGEARRRFLAAYQERKGKSLRHDFLARDVTWAQVPHLQARLLARTLRDDLDAYPPFVVR